MSAPLEFTPTGEMSPPKTPFEGVHFSNSDISGGVIHGSRRGSSPEASDAHRLHTGRGAPSGVHVYRRGSVAHPKIGSRKHAHSIVGDKAIADISGSERGVWAEAFAPAYKAAIASGASPKVAKNVANNAAEHSLIEQGWDGYEASAHQPGSVLLFGDQKTVTASPFASSSAPSV